MDFQEKINSIPFEPQHRIKMTYQDLQDCGFDTGFISEIKDGHDFHKITKDICISFMHFRDHHLTNLLFAGSQPIHLDLDDQEIISYYSDYIELRYIIEGSLEVEIEGEIVAFNAGEICFIDSMAYHKESIPHSNCLILNISIQRQFFTEAFLKSVGMSSLQKFLRKNIMKESDQNHFLRFTPQPGTDSDRIQDYLYSIVTEVVGMLPGYLAISKGYLIRLMDTLTSGYRYNFSKEETSEYSEQLFSAVTEYMNLNLQTVMIQDLTNEFHYQANYFTNLIRKYTGMTYSDYLIFLRIDRAKHFLKSSNIAIEEIMWLVGYNNKGFFYKKFKEATGMNPAKYRKEKAVKAKQLLRFCHHL